MKFSHLSDRSLHTDLLSLVREERLILANILWHMLEVDLRKLYSDHKCSSLFDYCVTVLSYSEAQASRRVSACRLLRDVPEIAGKIEEGGLNLTQINLASSFFQQEGIKKPEVKKKILDMMVGLTTRQTEQMLWELRNESGPRKVSLVLNEQTVFKLRSLKERKAHVYNDLDELLEDMCEQMEEHWKPKASKRAIIVASSGRYVPVKVRTNVWERDLGKCQICGSQRSLEYDHVTPYAVGGKTTEDNLRLLCRNCNQRKGIVQFGYNPARAKG